MPVESDHDDDVWGRFLTGLDMDDTPPPGMSVGERVESVCGVLEAFIRTMTSPIEQWKANNAARGGDYGDLSFAANYDPESLPEKKSAAPEKLVWLNAVGTRMWRALDDFRERSYGADMDVAMQDADAWSKLPPEKIRQLPAGALVSTDPVGLLLGRSQVPGEFAGNVAAVTRHREVKTPYRIALQKLVRDTVTGIERLPVILPAPTRDQLLIPGGQGRAPNPR